MNDTVSPATKNPHLKGVNTISGHFFVPSYQRGYRWGQHEVKTLLDDIYSGGKRVEGVKYCLQPIVVKERVANANEEGRPQADNPYYELIDGQQRLTTLYLLYHYLKKAKGIHPRFTLAYETRPGSTSYLLDPKPEQKDDNIDFFHMYAAYQCIEEWFENTVERSSDGELMAVLDDIYRILRKQIDVIWYDAGDQDAITLFTRLNVGRIPLTNAELVKALLLTSKGDAVADQFRQIEIATQWDMIEQALQNDAFWAFLTNRPGSDYPTRIELLFDLVAGKAESEKDRFFTFEFFRKRLTEEEQKNTTAKTQNGEGEKSSQQEAWTPVRDLYHLLREWFDDRERYHKIGYLVTTGVPLADLIRLATGEQLPPDQPPPTKSTVLVLLDEKISKNLQLNEEQARGLNYKNNYQSCERLLLLFNVESVRLLENSTERYPFDSHKQEGWSLEHIHAQNAEPLTSEDGWRKWLEDSNRALAALPHLETQDKEASKEALMTEIKTILGQERVERKHFEPLSRRITSDFLEDEDSEDEKDSIANLALLSGRVNSALNNAAFQAKRLRILDLDQSGAFIPFCTRRVFFKYYTRAGSQQMHLWSREDRESYLDAMLAASDSAKGRKEGVIRKYLKNEKSVTGIES